jgi:nucleotide-binding universal stress UspA family protein
MIPEIKKILYTTDLSRNSAYAFHFAVDMARKRDARIAILHVIEPIPASVRHYVSLYVEESKWDLKLKYEQDQTAKRIESRLEAFCRGQGGPEASCAGLVSSILVRPGNPVEEILKAVEAEGADLVILGSHGKGFLKQTFLGSTARSVLDRVRKPVLIIPLPEGETAVTFEEI